MICKKCGTDNTDGNKYCSCCGEPLIEDIVSDSHMEQSASETKDDFVPEGVTPAPVSTKRYHTRRVASTKEFHKKGAQPVKFRRTVPRPMEEQPKTDKRRDYRAPQRAVNTRGESAIYDYNDNFEGNKYEKTQREPYYEMQDQRRRKSAAFIPYLVVTYVTALVSLLNFAAPFLEWIRFQFNVDMINVHIDALLTPYDIIDNVLKVNDVRDLFGDTINNFLSWDVMPDFLGSTYDKLNAGVMFAKIASIAVFAVMAVSLLLYVFFFFLAVFQRRSATGFGIAAAIMMLLSTGGFIFAVTYVVSQTDASISLTNAPYQMIVLSVVMVILISIMSVLRAFSRRR